MFRSRSRHRPPTKGSLQPDALSENCNMVTGIETAGLVLATFPIVVDGLSRFAEGVETMKSWRRYRRELATYVRTLEVQQIFYQDTIEELLDGIIRSDDELKMLLDDPKAASWQKPLYEERLRKRLDHSYKPYMVTMTDILTALQTVRKRLGLSDSGKVQSFRVSRNFPFRMR